MKQNLVEGDVISSRSVHSPKCDAEGRVIIDMTVKDDSSFLSVYSASDTPVISTEVAEFIENSTHAFSPRQPLCLRIHSDCIDEQEQNDYPAGIREYYTEKYLASKNEARFNRIAVLLLMLAGVIALALAFRVEHRIWSEVIDIAAWVFLWEAVDIAAFKSREINLKRKRYLTYIAMKVEYMPLHLQVKESGKSVLQQIKRG